MPFLTKELNLTEQYKEKQVILTLPLSCSMYKGQWKCNAH